VEPVDLCILRFRFLGDLWHNVRSILLLLWFTQTGRGTRRMDAEGSKQRKKTWKSVYDSVSIHGSHERSGRCDHYLAKFVHGAWDELLVVRTPSIAISGSL
jgi:hypothetical protein